MSSDPVAAEGIVLGAALSGGRVDLLDPAEFSQPKHEALWSVLQRMTGDGRPVDPVSVLDALRESPVPGVDAPLLHGLVASVPVVGQAGYYAGIVREHAELRAVREAGVRLAQAASGGDAQVARAKARRVLDELDSRGSSCRSLGDLLADTLSEIDAGVAPGVSSPWPDLDARLGGLRPGTSTVIAARPGLGKSIIGLQLAAHVAARHGPVLLHSLEMSSGELIRRLLAASAHVSFASLNGRPDDLEWARLSRVIGDLSALPLHVQDEASVSVSDIAARARQVARAGLRMVVVDYLQLVAPADRRLPREQQVAEVSRGLKVLAKDLGVAVVVLAQLNRASEMRADKRPTLADLRESGAIEADADVVLLLFRDEVGSPDRLEVGVGKNRGGPRGMVALHWDARFMRVTSAVRQAS